MLKTQLEHTDKMCGNWRLGNDSRVKDAFWPEFQSAMLGRKDAKTALADADRRVARELRRACASPQTSATCQAALLTPPRGAGWGHGPSA